VFEDTPESFAPGTYQRTTITIEPQANPAIPDDAFTFTPPA
jgi:outer membrane lipoprotein-sorting protein